MTQFQIRITTLYTVPNTNDLGIGTGVLQFTYERGHKQYEMTNHLGNVLVTITDRKINSVITLSGISDYEADITSISDYYPFGMAMEGRGYSAKNYRYGFNGQEKDDEVSGEGNSMTAEFWQYDSRLGRRFNLDPVPQITMSDYSVNGNNPIYYIDPNGAFKNRFSAWAYATFTGGNVGEYGDNNPHKESGHEYYVYKSGERGHNNLKWVQKFRRTVGG